MPKFITIGYGDQAGYDRTPQPVRDAAHEQDAKLRSEGAIVGIAGKPVQVRNPGSVRPWQHVLEALGGYLLIAERLLKDDKQVATAFNFGPSDDDTRPVSWVVERMLDSWGGGEWVKPEAAQPHEATLLRLDCSKARAELGWRPRFGLQDALDKVVEWHKNVADGRDARAISLAQIDDYMARG